MKSALADVGAVEPRDRDRAGLTAAVVLAEEDLHVRARLRGSRRCPCSSAGTSLSPTVLTRLGEHALPSCDSPPLQREAGEAGLAALDEDPHLGRADRVAAVLAGELLLLDALHLVVEPAGELRSDGRRSRRCRCRPSSGTGGAASRGDVDLSLPAGRGAGSRDHDLPAGDLHGLRDLAQHPLRQRRQLGAGSAPRTARRSGRSRPASGAERSALIPTPTPATAATAVAPARPRRRCAPRRRRVPSRWIRSRSGEPSGSGPAGSASACSRSERLRFMTAPW